MDFETILGAVSAGKILSEAEAEFAFERLMEGAVEPVQAAAFLMGLRVRGETAEEITAAARAMRRRVVPLAAPEGAMDIVGTGGDGLHTLNISTATALCVAACGVPVAKHGNRAISSRCGAGDVLAALGWDLEAPFETIEATLRATGFGFMLAPRHHPAMRHVGPVRTALKIRTIFNILGPLTNPAGVKRLLVGTFDAAFMRPMAETLASLGAECAWVVHGRDGSDEVTPCAVTDVCGWDGAQFREFSIAPEDVGLSLQDLAAIEGGDAAFNAAAIVAMAEGEDTPLRRAVLLGGGAALVVAGQAEDVREGVHKVTQALNKGAVLRVIEGMRSTGVE